MKRNIRSIASYSSGILIFFLGISPVFSHRLICNMKRSDEKESQELMTQEESDTIRSKQFRKTLLI